MGPQHSENKNLWKEGCEHREGTQDGEKLQHTAATIDLQSPKPTVVAVTTVKYSASTYDIDSSHAYTTVPKTRTRASPETHRLDLQVGQDVHKSCLAGKSPKSNDKTKAFPTYLGLRQQLPSCSRAAPAHTSFNLLLIMARQMFIFLSQIFTCGSCIETGARLNASSTFLKTMLCTRLLISSPIDPATFPVVSKNNLSVVRMRSSV